MIHLERENVNLSNLSVKRLLLTMSPGGTSIEVDVEDPNNTTLLDIVNQLKEEGVLDRNFDPTKYTFAYGNELKPLDLQKTISELGLPDNAVVKMVPVEQIKWG